MAITFDLRYFPDIASLTNIGTTHGKETVRIAVVNRVGIRFYFEWGTGLILYKWETHNDYYLFFKEFYPELYL